MQLLQPCAEIAIGCRVGYIDQIHLVGNFALFYYFHQVMGLTFLVVDSTINRYICLQVYYFRKKN